MAAPLNTRGGAFRWLRESARILQSLGHDVAVLVGGSASIDSSDFEPDVGVKHLVLSGRLPGRRSERRAVDLWFSTERLDVIISALPRANVLALAANTGPVVPTIHGSLPSGGRGMMYRVLYQSLGYRAAAWGAVSSHQLDEYRGLVDTSRWAVIPNAVSAKPERPTPQQHGVAWVGRLVPEKGTGLLADIIPLLDVPIDVVGSGPEMAKILHAQHSSSGVLTVHGWCDDPLRIVRGRSIYLSTSPSEGMSYALLDAVASGLVPLVRRQAFEWADLPSECLYSDAAELRLGVDRLGSIGYQGRCDLLNEVRLRFTEYSWATSVRAWESLIGRVAAK
jgi:glycosyltransferase involved in cell wall biosynthesis